MNLDDAVKAHAEWKTKFRSAISKHEKLDATSIGKDDCCSLGKWLHGDGKSQFGKLASYAELVTKHAVFHVEAGKVARTINAMNLAEAENMINAGTSYARASSEVGVAILHFKKEANM